MKHSIVEVNDIFAEKISQLMKMVYKDSFSQRDLYDREAICELINNKRAIFFMALDQNQSPLAVLGLRFYSDHRSTGEFIPFVTLPTIRGLESAYLIKNIMDAFELKIRELVESGILKTLFACATTDHPLIQEFCEFANFKLTGMPIAWTAVASCVPEIEQVQIRTNKKVEKENMAHKRRSDLLYVRCFPHSLSAYEVALPQQFSMLLKKIYEPLNLPVKYSSNNELVAKKTVFEVVGDRPRKRMVVDVEQVANDCFTNISPLVANEIKNNMDVIQLILPITQGDISNIVNNFTNIGFKFCGLMPFHKNNDSIILQYINCQDHEMPERYLKSTLSKEIYSEIMSP